MKEMAGLFSLKGLTKSAAVFDREKLNWIDGHHIRRADLDRLTNLAIPFLKEAGFLEDEVTEEKFGWMRGVVEALRKHLDYLAEIEKYGPIFFADDVPPANEEAVVALKGREVVPLLELLEKRLPGPGTPKEFWQGLLEEARNKLGLKGKKLYLPLRVVLTGNLEGPELKDIMPLISLELVAERVKKALERLKAG